MERLSGVGVASAAQVVSAPAVKTAERPSIAGSSTSGTADRASVSGAGALIQQALSTSDVQTDKVVDLQLKIANKSYAPAAEDVAGKVIVALGG